MLIAIVQLGVYIYTSILNPGLPKLEYENNYGNGIGNYRRCSDCQLLINTQNLNYHCYDCQVCIEGN